MNGKSKNKNTRRTQHEKISIPAFEPLSAARRAAHAGAGFIVAIAGEMLRMPGLPKHPQAHQIKVVNGKIEGLY